MSWQSYVDNLMGSEHFESVAIVDVGGKELASTDGFTVTPEEATKAASALEEGADKRKEVRVGGVSYTVMSQLPGIIFGRLGYTGVTLYKTKEAMLVGVFPGSKNKDARESVEKAVNDIIAAGH